MKLRNKKTGEIMDLYGGLIRDDGEHITIKPSVLLEKCYIYNSLAELNEEWEDYKEPKSYYWIRSGVGDICEATDGVNSHDDFRKSIGNYFETREEAEKAVEKLKAWKRLKDKGLRFERWSVGGEYGNTITFSDYIKYNDETRADLDLLFGGEE